MVVDDIIYIYMRYYVYTHVCGDVSYVDRYTAIDDRLILKK